MKTQPDPHHTALHALDQQVWFLVNRLSPYAKTEPDERIEIANAILMLQQDRNAMVAEIMVKMYGGKGNA